MRASSFGFALVTLAAAACGSEDSTLFSLPPGATDGGAGATPDGGAAGGDGGATTAPDGGGVTTPDGGASGPPVTVDGGGPAVTLSCGPFTCKLPGEQCCVFGGPTYACLAQCPNMATALKCASAADCGGKDVCCVSQNPLKSACMKACGPNDAMLCDPAAANSKNRCANNAPCSNANIGDWGLPGSYGTCGGVGN